ncbi:MAG: hypothetical protein METHP_00333 [Methanoregula sp. SKADARSKE-2]|nr:MAG: hypothetical protein METHP_00333 [Methanoregula sp. SKADARSKE-2]
MKRSEKVKGKEAAALRRKKSKMYGIGIAAGIIVVAVIIGFFLLSPSVAKTGDTVDVYYTGTLDNGTVFDKTANGTPLEFVIGKHSVIPGLESAVVGMTVNTEKTVWIPVDQAFGPYRSDLILVLNRSSFEPNQTLNVGERYDITTNPSTGATTKVKIVNVTASTVTLDPNPPLTDQNLTFAIKLVKIKRSS